MPTPQSAVTATREHVLTMVDAINHLFVETGRLFNQYENQPSSGSIAVQEQKNFPKAELVRDVHYRGLLSMKAAADHLVAFADSLTEPAKTVAPWTCVRGLLESSAIGVWFLSPQIDVRERSPSRLGRALALGNN